MGTGDVFGVVGGRMVWVGGTGEMLTLLLYLILVLSTMNYSTGGSSNGGDDSDRIIAIISGGNGAMAIGGSVRQVIMYSVCPVPSILTIFFSSTSGVMNVTRPDVTTTGGDLLSRLCPRVLGTRAKFVSKAAIGVRTLTTLGPSIMFCDSNGGRLNGRLASTNCTTVTVSTGG